MRLYTYRSSSMDFCQLFKFLFINHIFVANHIKPSFRNDVKTISLAFQYTPGILLRNVKTLCASSRFFKWISIFEACSLSIDIAITLYYAYVRLCQLLMLGEPTRRVTISIWANRYQKFGVNIRRLRVNILPDIDLSNASNLSDANDSFFEAFF